MLSDAAPGADRFPCMIQRSSAPRILLLLGRKDERAVAWTSLGSSRLTGTNRLDVNLLYVIRPDAIRAACTLLQVI